jgi:hypothetical protein
VDRAFNSFWELQVKKGVNRNGIPNNILIPFAVLQSNFLFRSKFIANCVEFAEISSFFFLKPLITLFLSPYGLTYVLSIPILTFASKNFEFGANCALRSIK